MAKDSCSAIREVITQCVDMKHLARSTRDKLENASAQLYCLDLFLGLLEKHYPENWISAQLSPLFIEAYEGFTEIRSLLKDQRRLKRDAIRMISGALKLIQPKIIAERIKPSKQSRSISSHGIISKEMVNIVIEVCLVGVDTLKGNLSNQSIVKAVKKLKYVGHLIKFTVKRCNNIEHDKVKDLFTLVEDIAYTAVYLSILCWDRDVKTAVLESKWSKLLEKVTPIRPEWRQLYISVLKVSYSFEVKTPMMDDSLDDLSGHVDLVLRFTSSVMDDLEELKSAYRNVRVAFYDRFTWLEDGLARLSKFHPMLLLRGTDSQHKDSSSLLSFAEALAMEAAIAVYSLYDVDLEKTIEVEDMFLPLLVKFNHLKVEFLLFHKLSLKTPMMDFLHEEVAFMRIFLMDSLDQCKEKTQITCVSTLVYSAGDIIVSIIRVLEETELPRDIILPLKFKFMLIKAIIRQICPFISTSSAPEHPVLYPLNLPIISASSTPEQFIRDLKYFVFSSYFEVVDSYFKKLETSKQPYKPTMDEVFMGFYEYILEDLLREDEADEKFMDTDHVKRFYSGLLVLVTILADPPTWYSKCKKENDLLADIGTVAIEVEGSMCLPDEDALGSRKSRKTILLDKFSAVAFKLIKCVVQLTDLLKQKATKEAQFLDLVGNPHEELIFLRALLMDLLGQHSELDKLNDLLMLAEVAAHKATLFSTYCNECLMNERSTVDIPDVLQEIESVKIEVREVCFQILDASPCNTTLLDVEGLINFLLSQLDMLLDSDAGSISFLKNQITVIKEKLLILGPLLADIVQYHSMHQELEDLVERVQDVTNGSKYVCFFSVKVYRPAWYYMLHLSDIKALLKFVETEVKMIILKVPDSSCYKFPKTNGLGFLNYFLGKLEELLCSKLDSMADLKHQIGLVKEGLLCLRDLFAENCDELDGDCGIIVSATEMAYKAEFVIDSCLACSHPPWYKVLWISKVAESIKLVNKAVSESFERKKRSVVVHKVIKTSTDLATSLSANTTRSKEELEVFEEAMDRLKKQLLGGSPQLDVISIVGMPGIGKTTLAEKIYHDLIVTHHFDVHAKCCVTQVYTWRELLCIILNDVLEPADRAEKDDGELADEVRRFLLTKRFLILIDDVWEKEVWDNFYMCFKDSQNRSRIILTTRLSDVASYAQCESNPHHLHLLGDNESWTLLQKKVFHRESCPHELLDVGFRIAKSCGGLPLFIVLVAGVLKEKEKKVESWKEVEDSLGSQNIGRLEDSMSIIGFSYKNLPHQLRPCFLYFGGLLKGRNISVSKLTRLWLAEGFLQENKEKGSEDAAQGLLEDLISRNLVMDAEKRPNGRLKTCRIHDLLHKFCLEKAKQENFLHRINGFNGEDTFPEKPTEYRLFIHSYEDQIDLWQPSRSNVRSLLFNVIDPDNLSWPHNISFIFDNFSLVKVLDLESINIGSTFPSEVQFLIYMRYFAAQTGANSIPSSIAKLQSLETLVIRGMGGEVILPSSLLKMDKLRHMHVNHRASFNLHENTGESLAETQLPNLETLSSPHLLYDEDTAMILKKMPNLRKLSCITSGTISYSEKVKGRCVLFPRLEFLSSLESLMLVSDSYPAKLPHVFSFPSRLRELTLSKFRLPWSQICAIGELPNLEVLKLQLRAFEGDEWEVKDTEFPELKYLKLEDLNIVQWSVSEDAFPLLERLVLTKCKQLKEIPSHFEDAISLRSIEINWCNWFVANSAQEIQTTQREDMANDAFTVIIQPPDWARGSSP